LTSQKHKNKKNNNNNKQSLSTTTSDAATLSMSSSTISISAENNNNNNNSRAYLHEQKTSNPEKLDAHFHHASPNSSIETTTASAATTVEDAIPFLVVYKPYKNHLFALIILLVICMNSAVIVYDYICLYQLTSDTIPFWSAICYIAFILWYIFLWLVLTFKSKWSFEFSHLFKLNYWNFSNKYLAATNNSSNTTPFLLNGSIISEQQQQQQLLMHQNRNSLCKSKFSNNQSIQQMASSYTTATNLVDVYNNEYEYGSRSNLPQHQQQQRQQQFNNMTLDKKAIMLNRNKANSLLYNNCNTNSLSMSNLIGLSSSRSNFIGVTTTNETRNELIHNNNNQSEYATDLIAYENFNSSLFLKLTIFYYFNCFD
jgi:hypothetical protein